MPSLLETTRARVPLRLGLAGGGTDLSPYCDQFGGAVLNTTIGRYAYASIEPSTDGQVHFIAPDMDQEEVFPPDLDALARARLVLHAGVTRRMITEFGDKRLEPIRVTSYVDAPPGSSHNFVYEHVDFVLDTMRRVLAEHPPGAH